MKKIGFICFALALIACGCSKEQSNGLLDIVPEGNVVSFKATFEGETPDTKLGINTGSGALTWMDGDAIAVQMTDDTFVQFTYSSSTGKFSASLGEKKVKDGGVAYYPSTIAINGTPGSVNLPSSYDVSVSGSIAKVCPPMIATVNLGDENLALKHLGGILSVKVSYVPADANMLILTVPGKTVTGTFAVTDGHISATSGSSTVTINFTKGVFGTTATEFFIPVPVTTFSSGFTADFKNASNETLYTHTTAKTSISAARASIKRMAELTVPKYVYIYNNTTWSGAIYAYLYGANSSSEEVNNSWPGTALTGDTFTHNGHAYYRVSLPNDIATDANIILHGDTDFLRSDNHADVPHFSINRDAFLTAETFAPSSIRVFLMDETKWTNAKVYSWYEGGSQIVGGSFTTLPTISKDSREFRYFDVNYNSDYKIELKADWDGEYSSGALTPPSLTKDLVYYWKGKDNDAYGNWYYISEYPIAKVTVE